MQICLYSQREKFFEGLSLRKKLRETPEIKKINFLLYAELFFLS